MLKEEQESRVNIKQEVRKNAGNLFFLKLQMYREINKWVKKG